MVASRAVLHCALNDRILQEICEVCALLFVRHTNQICYIAALYRKLIGVRKCPVGVDVPLPVFPGEIKCVLAALALDEPERRLAGSVLNIQRRKNIGKRIASLSGEGIGISVVSKVNGISERKQGERLCSELKGLISVRRQPDIGDLHLLRFNVRSRNIHRVLRGIDGLFHFLLQRQMDDLELVRVRNAEVFGKLVPVELRRDAYASLLRLKLDFRPVTVRPDKSDIVKKRIRICIALRFIIFRELPCIIVQRLHVGVIVIAVCVRGNGRYLQLHAGRDRILILKIRSDCDIIVLVDIETRPLCRKYEEKLCIFRNLSPLIPVSGIRIVLPLRLDHSVGIVRGCRTAGTRRNLHRLLRRRPPDPGDHLPIGKGMEIGIPGSLHVLSAPDFDRIHRRMRRIVENQLLVKRRKFHVHEGIRQELA